MIKTILTYPKDEKTLSQISNKVEQNEDIKELVQDLKDTLHSQPEGRGLSAIQIGVPKQVCICLWGDEEIVMINPKIVRSRGEQEFSEGCLSAPGKVAKVTRFQKVWCEYTDENGEQKEIAEGGRMSDIIQHEMDHFQGICKVL